MNCFKICISSSLPQNYMSPEAFNVCNIIRFEVKYFLDRQVPSANSSINQKLVVGFSVSPLIQSIPIVSVLD